MMWVRGMDRGIARHVSIRSSRLIPALALAAVAAAARPAHAVDPVPSFRYLVTGNGFGFQVFDVSANAVKQFLERPYRYIRANASNPDGEGIVRRNLVFDTYFGAKVGGQASWFGGRAPSEVGYLEETNVIRSVVTMGSVTTESYYFSPYGYSGNAMISADGHLVVFESDASNLAGRDKNLTTDIYGRTIG